MYPVLFWLVILVVLMHLNTHVLFCLTLKEYCMWSCAVVVVLLSGKFYWIYGCLFEYFVFFRTWFRFCLFITLKTVAFLLKLFNHCRTFHAVFWPASVVVVILLFILPNKVSIALIFVHGLIWVFNWNWKLVLLVRLKTALVVIVYLIACSCLKTTTKWQLIF